MIYRIKTNQGYYFTESNGRYVRFYGQQGQYEPLCKEHAEIMAENWRHILQIKVEVEETRSNIPCAICKREAQK
jgi:hypothetical protein